jgi:hypothetical protein
MNSDNFFDTKDEAIATLVRMFVCGNINHAMVAEAEAKAAIIKEEQEKLKKANQEKRRLHEIAQSVPEIRFPKVWNYRNVNTQYRDELDSYILSRPIPELEGYLEGLQNGACTSEDFLHKSGFEAAAYLSAAIRRRKATSSSTSAVPSQSDIENLNAKAEDIAKKQKELSDKVNKALSPQTDAKAKAYTA